MFLGAVTLMAWVMPLVVAGSFVTGIIDGRTRYRKLTPPFLKTKIRAGIALFVLSLASLAVVVTPLWPGVSGTLIMSAVAAGQCACAAVLGAVGVELAGPRLPG
jgi:cytochrome b561